jgi:hypothetical protein
VQAFIVEGKKVRFRLSFTDGKPKYELKIEEEQK